MARTGHDGPDYGALGILAHAVSNPAVSQTDLEIYETTVPADEDWYVHRVHVWCDTAGVTPTATVDIEDDTVSILSSAMTLVADTPVIGTLAVADTRVAASSALTFDITTGTTAPTLVHIVAEGWRRFIGTPRGRTNPL